MTAPKRKKDESYKDFIMDALSDLDGLRVRAMFGGYGLYLKDDFFGIIWKGRTYFKVDDETRPEYAGRGGKPFRVDMRGKEMTMQYYDVPADVLEDREELSRLAVRAARAYHEGKKRGKK